MFQCSVYQAQWFAYKCHKEDGQPLLPHYYHPHLGNSNKNKPNKPNKIHVHKPVEYIPQEYFHNLSMDDSLPLDS